MEPKIIYIETTNLCNAKCIMCPHERITRYPNFMSDDIFNKALKDCKKMKMKNKQIFLHKEGEPLLDPKIMERLKCFANEFSKDNEVGINTNAMLLTKEKTLEFIDSGANLIFFSVDGVNKEQYEKIRINLDYDIVEKNIIYFLETCKNRNVKIRIVMQMLVQSDNDIRIHEFIRKWEDYPCEIYIKRMHGYLDGGHSSQSKRIEKQQISTCEDPFRIAVVYTSGDVGLCCWDYNNEYSIGNIMENEINVLFNNERAQKLRKVIKEKRCSEIIPCNRCARVFGHDKITEY